MNSNRPNRKTLRGVAAVTLMVWLVAQFFCTLHCTSWQRSNGPSVAASKGCCQKKVQNGEANPLGESESPAKCFALKLRAAVPSVNNDLLGPTILSPAIAILLVESFTLPTAESSVIQRATWRPDRVIAHEVSLGSSARSHAPPSLA